jgi:hypothetical protein
MSLLVGHLSTWPTSFVSSPSRATLRKPAQDETRLELWLAWTLFSATFTTQTRASTPLLYSHTSFCESNFGVRSMGHATSALSYVMNDYMMIKAVDKIQNDERFNL